MTITQTALERELLLVPAPESALADSWSPAGGETPGHEQEDSHGPAEAMGATTAAYQVRSALIMVAILTVGLVVQLTLVDTLVHRSAQISMFNQFRTQLALGTAPLGDSRNSLPLGTPIALISIPSIGVQQVVAEGTTGLVLAKGPGHLRSRSSPVEPGRASSSDGPPPTGARSATSMSFTTDN